MEILLSNGGTSSMIIMFLPLILLGFFLFRSSKKQKAAREELETGLRVGDEVITTAGIYGKIKKIAKDPETTVVLEIDDGVKIKIEKQAIMKNTSLVNRVEKESDQEKAEKEVTEAMIQEEIEKEKRRIKEEKKGKGWFSK